MLVQQWGILWRLICCTLQHNVLIVLACFALHNWCEERKVHVPLHPPDGVCSIQLEELLLFDDSSQRPLEMFGHVDEDDTADDDR